MLDPLEIEVCKGADGAVMQIAIEVSELRHSTYLASEDRFEIAHFKKWACDVWRQAAIVQSID
jgi:hypothetical protein